MFGPGNPLRALSVLLVTVLMAAAPAAALESGTDVFVAAVARAGDWLSDLYLFNPADEAATVTVYWLARNRANLSPVGSEHTLQAGEVLVLEDVVSSLFGYDSAGGALRIVSDLPVVATTRTYNLKNGVTFGQGVEGVPRSAAVAAGGSADILGLESNTRFRSNLVLVDTSGSGSSVELSLRDEHGNELATGSYQLDAFEPVLDPVTGLSGTTSFDTGRLHLRVTSGAVLALASRVDNDPQTGDPTTLAAWTGDTVDGLYEVSVYDSEGYATGGNIVVRAGRVISVDLTYANWDKGLPDSECTSFFRIGGRDAGAHTLVEYAKGVSFDQPYQAATMTWTLRFSVSGARLTGTIDATGTDFSGELQGCNGSFPTLQLRGGKTR